MAALRLGRNQMLPLLVDDGQMLDHLIGALVDIDRIDVDLLDDDRIDPARQLTRGKVKAPGRRHPTRQLTRIGYTKTGACSQSTGARPVDTAPA